MNMFNDFDPYEFLKQLSEESECHSENIKNVAIQLSKQAQMIEKMSIYIKMLTDHMNNLYANQKRIVESIKGDHGLSQHLHTVMSEGEK